MFRKCWLNKKDRGDLKLNAEKVAIRCTNCLKETMIDLDLLETYYQEIITSFLFNTMLHHVGTIWMIEIMKI